MADRSINATRLDPYKNFKFRLKWDGMYPSALVDLSELRRSSEVIGYRQGGDPSQAHRSPGRSRYEAITLDSGLTQDLAFQNWANLVWGYGSNLGAEVSLLGFRKNIDLEFYNEAGQPVASYKVFRCWLSMTAGRPSLSISLHSRSGFHPAFAHIRLETSISL